ncbi:MAG: 16S rRNA (adenine(1518)-N(6)/adenine(1519)-N(6))-dimethyltransferase RsmA [Armatimonadota bacterium]|nr:16S rRNA (adenine(1518)-N(6)/adenine(1519)-N(6))-dimethyltransferase RsmA [Armatimonadota bacterium]MCX7778352.1 16S rRNA (adenine(1518)-N(6)/adenine(1519)-N(6))-dimethyltransferase RsmA [Armatimonadota bacterium]MDW8025120.1 16S rRNA (adenine(1518)-N(6)/adenine(1519)-N(6))-dimethyltransferase RsmA [Armatimonadota bacterium]
MNEHPIDPLRLCAPSAVLSLMQKHHIRPNKSLGQHFLIDRNVLRRIISAAQIQNDDHVLEIGTGFGTLTAAIAVRCKLVVTVEKDKKLARIAEELLSPFENVRLLIGDFTELELHEVLEHDNVCERPWKVIGNLPYYATKPILMKLLSHRSLFELCTLTIQREVAERIASSHGTKAYGILSIAAQLFTDVELLFDIPPTCFFPPPKVTSKVIRLRVRKVPKYEVHDEALFFRLVRAAFSERRKRIINSLSSRAHLLGLSKEQIGIALNSAGIDPSTRAEHVNIDSFVRLAGVVHEMLIKAQTRKPTPRGERREA